MLDGIWIGLIAAVGIIVLFYGIAASKKPDFNAKSRRAGTLKTPLTPEETIGRLQERAGGIGLKVALVDNAGHRVILSEGMTLFSWGMFFPISAKAANGDTVVTVGLTPRAPQYGPVLTHKHNKAMDKVRGMLAGA